MSAAAVSFGIDSKCGSERADRCLPRPAHQLFFFFFSNFWGLAILKKFNTETRVYRTKFGNVTFIFKRSQYGICNWSACDEDTIKFNHLATAVVSGFFSIVLGCVL